MNMERMNQQMNFLIEIDKLKSVYRRAFLVDRSRNENDAEHSWHLAMMALLLREHAAEPHVDLLRVLKMLLIHDIVEIDAGDFSPYEAHVRADKQVQEQAAARRLFGLLPEEQCGELLALWQEFEARETAEAKYASALDRLSPILLNVQTEGKTWQQHGITAEMVIARNRQPISEGSEILWHYAEELIRDAVLKGYLPAGGER